MLPAQKKKAIDAIKRLEGLMKKLSELIEQDGHCPEILHIALAMQGHIKHIQGQVLESHLHTCAPEQLAKPGKTQDAFIAELLRVIGLSQR